MKKMYIAPKIEIFTPRIEKGFAGSGNCEMYLGSEEAVGYNGGVSFGGGPGGSSGNMEGVGYSGTIFF